MAYVIVFLVGAAAGGAGVWFFKDKALKEVKELHGKVKGELDELKNKGKE